MTLAGLSLAANLVAVNTLPPTDTLPNPDEAADNRRFDRVAWLVLTLALSLILLSAIQKAYRLTLPTDGWSFITGEIGTADQDRPTYQANLLGRPSPLQPGDRFLAVEGRSFETIYAQAGSGRPQSLPAGTAWRAGQTVRYTVERRGVPLELDVPLYTWPLGTVLREILSNPSLWASLLLAGVGWFVFLEQPHNWAARALLLFTICLLVVHLSWAVVDWGLPEMVTPGILPMAIFFSNWIFAVVMFPSLLLLTLVFPRPKWVVERHPGSVVLLLYGSVPLLIAAIGPIAPVGWISVLAMALLSLATMAHSLFTTRDPVGQAQMRWAVGGLAVMVLGFVPLNLSGLGWLPWPFPPALEAIWFPAMLVIAAGGFGVAILRYRLFDIDLLINRALVYGALTALVIGLYIFVVGYLSALFRVEEHLFISLAATGLVAVLFQPLRHWLQRAVNRLMYGRRDEPVVVLTQLGERLESTVSSEGLLPGLVETVAEALKLPYAAIALPHGDNQFEVVAEIGGPRAAIESFPLVYQGDTVGQLWVTPRGQGEALNSADRRLLENIARQVGAAVHAVRLAAALQQSRRQIITAREEERRRLRRDLHDGLGPQLASQTLTIDAISKQMATDPATALALLQSLKSQSQAAIHDIRRLVYELRPPALDELGLVEALREAARQYDAAGWRVSILASPTPLPPLPAAVEVAVYRIAREAITNATRHAGSRTCTVRIEIQGPRLWLSIIDDGPGFPTPLQDGVGLTSMRERTEELGGRLILDNQQAGGARVQLWLPLPEVSG